MAMVDLVLDYMEWPFVLQFSSSPLDFDFSPYWVPAFVRSILVTLRQIYFLQCSTWRGRSFWPWGTILLFSFCSALTSIGSISLTLRHDFVFYSALTSIGSISLTLRHEFDFCSALTSIGSISLTLRHDFDFCSALTSMGSIALTLRHEFNFYSALTSVGSISLTLRHEVISYSGSLYDIQTPGFFGNFCCR